MQQSIKKQQRAITASYFLIFAALLLSGCGGPKRFSHAELPKFTYLIIESADQGDIPRLTEALATYFEITTRAKVRLDHAQDRTVVVEYSTRRGPLGAESRVLFRNFDSTGRDGGRILLIKNSSGLLFLGLDNAEMETYRELDREAAKMSEKTVAKP